MDKILAFIILGLATWRVSSLISAERGPYAIFDKLRDRAGIKYINNEPVADSELAMGMACVHCNSVWVGAFASVLWLILGEPIVWIAMPLALSAAAIIIGKIVDG